MTFSMRERNSGAGRPGQVTGVALMTGSALSVQLGAATAALAFPVLGPPGWSRSGSGWPAPCC